MLKIRCVLLLFVICAAPGLSGASGGKEPSPEPVIGDTAEEDFAAAFVLRRSTSGLYAVFGSTSPEKEAAAYLRRGVYRAELLVLFDMSENSGIPLRELVLEREKGAALRDLALRAGTDLMRAFREAAALQDEIEAGIKAAASSGRPPREDAAAAVPAEKELDDR